MKDATGRPRTAQQVNRPKWTEPYPEDGLELKSGFRLLRYLGYRRKEGTVKGSHWYYVQCMTCKSKYERIQGGLTRALLKGTRGCNKCAKARAKDDREHAKEREAQQIEQDLQAWLWVNFLFRPTSLRLRYEMGQSFDSENAKVLGWRTI